MQTTIREERMNNARDIDAYLNKNIEKTPTYENEANIATANNGGVARPTDLLGIRDSIYSRKGGVNDAKQAMLDSKNILAEYDKTTKNRQFNISNDLVSNRKIARRRSSDINERNLGRDSIANEYRANVDIYNSAVNEAQQQISLQNQTIQETKALMLKYQGAGITYDMPFEEQVNKIYDFSKKQLEEQKEETYKNNIINMYTQVKGYPPKQGKSIKAMIKSIRKKSKKAAQAAEDAAEQQSWMAQQRFDADMQLLYAKIDATGRSNRGGRGGRTLKPYEEELAKAKLDNYQATNAKIKSQTAYYDERNEGVEESVQERMNRENNNNGDDGGNMINNILNGIGSAAGKGVEYFRNRYNPNQDNGVSW